MVDNQPKIEQISEFAAKTNDGQEVKFVATVKFYISPTGNVQINAPGSKIEGNIPLSPTIPLRSSGEPPPPQSQSAPSPSTVAPSTSEVSPQKTVKDKVLESPPSLKTKQDSDLSQSDGRFQRDKSMDRALNDCPITQFVPDPCKAIDDLQKSFKSLLSGFFGSGCPPCSSTSNKLIVDGSSVAPIADKEMSRSPSEGMDSETVENEKKYEV